ncbi:hypothetical protein LCGC14_0750560 [marine sediment metagenome]|uniref:Uncharacterized protein n=1 Tax=marine sediment metagenome TaxID=412755 RepID=A0A0F9Q442_9ZZZZ
MRTISLIFLCITVAFANVSYAHAYNPPCPMKQSAYMNGMDDCCNDAETAKTTGNPCKTNQNCSAYSPVVVVFFSSSSLRHIPTDESASLRSFFPLPSSIPVSVWRPPTIS